jgi:iron complex transport system substrate-binding protein
MAAALMLAFGRVSNMHAGALALSGAALLLISCSAAPDVRAPVGKPPMRIVSMNPCVDAILREVADPKQIHAISHYSQDPRATSVPIQWAMQYRATSGSAEDVIAERPDLVISGPHQSIQTIAALKRLGIPLMQIAVPNSVDESKQQIAAIAERIGRADKGRDLNAQIDKAMAGARSRDPQISALIWQGGGLVPGKDTLADEMMTRSGFQNLSGELGLKQWDILPLESMLARPPAVLLSSQADKGTDNGDSNRMLSHPALKKAGARIRVAHYPSSLLHCGGPTIIKAAARLSEIRRSFAGIL